MSRRAPRSLGFVEVHPHGNLPAETLPWVFDVRRRPWVDLDGAEANAVADAVERCPTGALRYERLDEAEGERPQRPTRVFPIEDGPLLMVGELDVSGPDGETITHETRLTLCRFGLSHNHLFCDSWHRRRQWKSRPSSTEPRQQPPAPPEHAGEEPTTVAARRDASLEVHGALGIYHSDARKLVAASRGLLCRCGQTSTRPSATAVTPGWGSEAAPPSRRAAGWPETPAAFAANPRVPDPTARAVD
jgi:CDGSH-type Zn-finger protein